MSSIIKVDQIQLADGSTPTAGDLGITGSAVQIVDSIYETSVGNVTYSTSVSWVTSNHSLTITPTSTTSKILLTLSGGGLYVDTAGSSAFLNINKSGVGYLGNSTYGFQRTYAGTSTIITPTSIQYVDTSGTTSAITYTIYFRSSTNGVSAQYQNSDRGDICFTAIEFTA